MVSTFGIGLALKFLLLCINSIFLLFELLKNCINILFIPLIYL